MSSFEKLLAAERGITWLASLVGFHESREAAAPADQDFRETGGGRGCESPTRAEPPWDHGAPAGFIQDRGAPARTDTAPASSGARRDRGGVAGSPWARGAPARSRDRGGLAGGRGSQSGGGCRQRSRSAGARGSSLGAVRRHRGRSGPSGSRSLVAPLPGEGLST